MLQNLHLKLLLTRLGKIMPKVVKITTILCVLATTQVTVANEFLEERIDLNVRHASLEKVLLMIEKQSDVGFVFKGEHISQVSDISVRKKDATIAEVLDHCLKGTNLNYTICDEIIQIQMNEVIQEKDQFVTGMVRDKAGDPVVGVNIIIKSSGLGSVTDIDGKYSVKVSSQPDVLTFSFIGFENQIIEINGSQVLDIVMVESIEDIGEVVCNGIMNRKASSFTGAVKTISSKDLERVSNTNIFESLKNLDPSLNIMSSVEFGSDPNRMPEIQLRGTSTFPGATNSDLRSNFQDDPNQPLFILDGFRVGTATVFDLDMSRVKSITILKDASAKALYGSRAANGVVVIETKRPITGELRAMYSGSVNLTMPDLTSYNLTNALEKLQVEKTYGVYENSELNSRVRLEKLYAKRLKKSLEGDDTYWLSKPLRTGVGTKHALSVVMGEQKIKFMANLSYNNVEGVMKGSGRTNIAGTVSVDYRHKNLLFRNVMSVTDNGSNDSPYGSYSEYSRMNPYWDAYNEDGSVATDGDYLNPLQNAQIGTKLVSTYFEFINNFYTEWTIQEGLKAIARVGITKKVTDADRYYPANHTKFSHFEEVDFFKRGTYQLNQGKYINISGDLNLQYSKNIDKHLIIANAGFNVGQEVMHETANYVEGFPSDRMNDITFALQYPIAQTPTGFENTTRDLGFLGILGYSYDDRFLADFTLRKTGSSKFGANSRWGSFWSIGTGWNIHNEYFLRNDWLKRLKLRGSVGSTGSQNFNSSQAITTYSFYTNQTYNGQLGSYIKNLGNKDLKWQQKFDYNIGLDVKVGRLSMTMDYYESFTDDLITNLSIAPSIGFSTVKENIGRIKNNGWEVTGSYQAWKHKDGFLNLNFSVASNDNEIIELSDAMKVYNNNQDKIVDGRKSNSPVLRYVEGGSLNSIWAVPSLGIDPATGREIYVKQDGTTTYEWDSSDQVISGNSLSKYRGHFGFNGEYKGFGFSVTARYMTGGDMYNHTLVNKVENIDVRYNVDARVLSGRWQTPGQDAAYKTLAPYNDEDGNEIKVPLTRPTTRFVQERGEIDISSVSLYYEMNRDWIKKVGMERLKFSVHMNEVHKFSNIKVERGTSYPFARMVSFSLKSTF